MLIGLIAESERPLNEKIFIFCSDLVKSDRLLEALDVAATFRPDVMLLDIGMPKLNGYEVCRRIRQEAWGKNIVVIALTGWGQEEDKRRSLAAGVDSHPIKPVDHAALKKLLTAVTATRA